MIDPTGLRWTYTGELLVIAAIGGIASGAGWHLARRGKPTGYACVCGGLIAMCLGPVTMLWPGLVGWLPQPLACSVEIYRALGLVLLGAACVLLEGRKSRRALVLGLAAAALVHTLRAPVALVLVGPAYARLAAPLVDGHMEQSTGSTCLPCSAAMALAHYGIQVSEGQMAARCRTTPFGTDTFRAARAIERLTAASGTPLRCRYRTGLSWRQLVNLRAPAVISVRMGAIGHAIFVRGDGTGGLLVGDPLRPYRVRMSEGQFSSRYRWFGDVLVVLKGD